MHEMKDFVDKILNELKANPTLNSQPLVKMLTESTEKSIALGEMNEKVYTDLKEGLTSIKKVVKSPVLESMLHQFIKLEDTNETRTHKIARKANIMGKLKAVRESMSGSNPMVIAQIEILEGYLNSGIPDFAICESFIKAFSDHKYDAAIAKEISKVEKYLNENRSEILLLNSIYTIDSMPGENYNQVSSDLKYMLVNEAYTSDILKIKYGNSVPLVNNLISDLRVLESQKMGYFTLGEGDSFTKVTNLIAPAAKAKDGMIVYMDDRFVSIRESKSLTGKEKKIYVDGNFKIAEIDPDYVKEKFPKFYKVAESFATLGFKKNIDGTGVESNSIRNFDIGFKLNSDRELDIYVNEAIIHDTDLNIMEALSLEHPSIKEKVITLFENSGSLFNLDFIKELTNDRTLAEATVLKLNNEFYVCEKLNSAERDWRKVDEHELYEFCMTKFNYDITPIFKAKIDEKRDAYRKIEEKKQSISVDITKLEETMDKLQKAISNPDLDSDAVKKLTGIRESVEASLNSLKQDYVGLDLFKKNI